MRFRLGMVIGFGAGYYLGAKAGRQRYEQINKLVNRTKRSETFEVATEKAKAVIDLGVERAKDAIDDVADKVVKHDDHAETETLDVTTPTGDTIPFRP